MNDLDCSFIRDKKRFRCRAAAIIIEDDCILFAGNENTDYLYSIGGAIQLGEKAEDAVKREVFEETGIHYTINRLSVIHENFFYEKNETFGYLDCHEICFYFSMNPKGSQKLNSHSYTNGFKEEMHWLPLKNLDQYRTFPVFLKNFFEKEVNEILHIVTDDRT